MCSGVRLSSLKGPQDIALPEPALTVRDELAEFDDPHAGLDFFDDANTTGELLAQGNLPTWSYSPELQSGASLALKLLEDAEVL